MNHEYTDANQIYSAAQGSAITPDAAGREKVAKALAGHGVSVISIAKQSQRHWDIVRHDPRNRRITGTTPMAFSGPVSASHPMLQSSITPSPIGTLNNCAMGYTPWGTYLACEENWNGYFGTDDTDAGRARRSRRATACPTSASATTGTRPSRASTWRRTATSSTTSAGWSRSIRSTRPRRP